jgi:hypothetical protein
LPHGLVVTFISIDRQKETADSPDGLLRTLLHCLPMKTLRA